VFTIEPTLTVGAVPTFLQAICAVDTLLWMLATVQVTSGIALPTGVLTLVIDIKCGLGRKVCTGVSLFIVRL
jgi:hypothetical protein